MNILLHICCAPCSIYPVEEITREGHKFAGYFYNPNIHPYSEYLKRRTELEKYSKATGSVPESFNFMTGDYELEKYLQNIVYGEERHDRCPVCWWLRMENTAKLAVENGFDAFSTTLLCSPYQDHDAIKNICEDLAGKLKIKFYYSDFRKGFRQGQDKARSIGMYMQNYCGCIFSEKERIEKKKS